ncbi:Transcriptional regulator [Sinomonas atrocyanea]|uniref:Transcriptional regulator n=1 Tax=Sinomonas atrocyanea TaxID=37927 RepID=A0A127A6W0_9MICC|nr:helix-turn-helix transcriptional regulator [Sinomonas atrocyanea]AMM34524.1 Transcriptional regulator [Sinomonas atrocyanea]GEB63002.1 putative DNA-binding protein [Sinomonas atrocyanea]GGG67990.1 putative DNA-binding protein [Sinomonas atrocyanea]
MKLLAFEEASLDTATPAETRRKELGAFLRSRRERAVRADYDLPPVGRGRTVGLRREEVAFLSGVSVTWYTWLEQGRDIHPSRQVLDAVAVNLRLSAPEHDYILGLSGFAPAPREVPGTPEPVPEHVQHLLDALDPSPAFAVTSTWDIGAWNSGYEALFPGIATVPARDRNLLRLTFTDPYVRGMLPDWEVTVRSFLADYRAEAGSHADRAAHVELVTRLREDSADFARAWDDHEVRRFASRARTFLHPVAGRLDFEQHQLVPADAPTLHIVAYLPAPGSDTGERMARLVGSGTDRRAGLRTVADPRGTGG